MIARGRVGAALAIVVALASALPSTTGCAFAVKHPAASAGIVAGTLGFGTCKLASDNVGGCLAVGGGAGVFLALVAAAAIWLGGDGNSVAVEEQAQPLPPDDRPRRQRPQPVMEPAEPAPGAAPASPAPASPTPASPPASPTPASPPASPTPASPPVSPPR
jgi:hypothetical protein